MIAALAAALLGLIAVGSPAQAAAPSPSYDLDDCDPGTVCLFDTKVVLPDFHRYVINDRTGCFNIPADWDNRTNVIYNRSSHSITAYTGNVCNGALSPYPILPGQRKGMGDNEEEANSILFHGGSGCLSNAPCLELGNAHNLRGFSKAEAQVTDCEELRGVCLYDGNSFNGDWYFINVPTTKTSFCFNLHSVGWGDRANSASIAGPTGRSYASFHRHTGCNSILDPPEYLVSFDLTTGLENNVTSSVQVTVNAP